MICSRRCCWLKPKTSHEKLAKWDDGARRKQKKKWDRDDDDVKLWRIPLNPWNFMRVRARGDRYFANDLSKERELNLNNSAMIELMTFCWFFFSTTVVAGGVSTSFILRLLLLNMGMETFRNSLTRNKLTLSHFTVVRLRAGDCCFELCNFYSEALKLKVNKFPNERAALGSSSFIVLHVWGMAIVMRNINELCM